jgi:hypothetical protein
MQKKVSIMALLLYFVTYFCFVFSLNLNFNFFESLLDKFNSVHFNTPWNDFIWTLFITNSVFQKQKITLNWDSISCNNLFQWYYYNSQRWDRVWPLDNWTLSLLKTVDNSYQNLSVTWWFHTFCSWDEHWIYGQITYDRSWTKSYLIAWTQLDYLSNTYKPYLAKSFQRFNWLVPLGYIWDSVWWIWFVGWMISWSNNLIDLLNSWSLSDKWNSINELFIVTWDKILSMDTSKYSFLWDIDTSLQTQNALLWWLCIQGMASLSCNDKIQSNLQINSYINNSNFISIWDVLNSSRQKYLKACSSYKNLDTNSLPWSQTSKDPYLCYIYTNYDTWKTLTIDLSNPDLYRNKYIVVKNTDIKLINSMNSASPNIEIFVDNWNILLSNVVSNMQSFDWSWYVNTIWLSSWVLLKWNIYVNWLILWEKYWVVTWYNHKLYFFWKIASLNTPCDDSSRQRQVSNMFGGINYSNFVNLQNVFVRTCNSVWIWSDGTSCWYISDNYAFCSIITKK